ncbi:hypothetical protein Hanom_Chr09g00791691 [Helianthus anomalus]
MIDFFNFCGDFGCVRTDSCNGDFPVTPYSCVWVCLEVCRWWLWPFMVLGKKEKERRWWGWVWFFFYVLFITKGILVISHPLNTKS